MNYCLDYYENNPYMDKAEELNINITNLKTQSIDEIKQWLELHKNQRINICTRDKEQEELIEQAFELQAAMPQYNIYINLASIYIPFFKEKIFDNYRKNKYYFNMPVKNIGDIYNAIDLEVDEVYISGDLAFVLPQAKELLDFRNIKIRAFPNICQKEWNGKTPSAFKGFFIRPENVDLYANYIDTLEFYGLDNEQKQNVLYETYAIEKRWYGPIKEIIIGLDDCDIDNRFIIPRFAQKRINCGRSCLYNNKCQLCDIIVALSNTLKQADLIVEEDK